jgi:hypothetical protein
VPAVSEAALPASLLERFVEEKEGMRLIRMLDFVKPVTMTSGGRNLMDA